MTGILQTDLHNNRRRDYSSAAKKNVAGIFFFPMDNFSACLQLCKWLKIETSFLVSKAQEEWYKGIEAWRHFNIGLEKERRFLSMILINYLIDKMLKPKSLFIVFTPLPKHSRKYIKTAHTKFCCNNGPNCNKVFSSKDAIRKHAKKKHGKWVENLKPYEYCTKVDDDEMYAINTTNTLMYDNPFYESSN